MKKTHAQNGVRQRLRTNLMSEIGNGNGGNGMKAHNKSHVNGNGNGNGQAHVSQIMTLKDVAKYLGLHVMTVYKLTRQGHIPSAKIGGQWRFKQDVLDAWLDAQMRQPHA